MLLKSRRVLPIVIFLYAGFNLMVIPRFLDISIYFVEIMQSMGIVVVIAGVIWLFFDRINNRLNRVLDFLSGPMSREINEFKFISGDDLYEVIRKSVGMSKPKIVVEYRTTGRWTYDFIDYLSMRSLSEDIKLLITGYKNDKSVDSKRNHKMEFNLFFEQLIEMQDKVDIEMTVRTYPVASNNTFILGFNNLSLILPLDPKGKMLLYIDVKPDTDLFHSYSRHFEEMWEGSTTYRE